MIHRLAVDHLCPSIRKLWTHTTSHVPSTTTVDFMSPLDHCHHSTQYRAFNVASFTMSPFAAQTALVSATQLLDPATRPPAACPCPSPPARSCVPPPTTSPRSSRCRFSKVPVPATEAVHSSTVSSQDCTDHRLPTTGEENNKEGETDGEEKDGNGKVRRPL